MFLETLYFIIDEYLKKSFHKEDKQVTMSDSEIIFVYIVAFKYHSGNYAKTLEYSRQSGLIKKVLSASRFSRRMNRLKDIIEQIQSFLSELIKKTSNNNEYCIDSFPLPICKNVRIKRCKLVQGKEYLGYNSSKDEYYYGFKVHLITAKNGDIVEFEYSPARYHDQIAFSLLNFDLPEGSKIFADKAYNNYLLEEIIKDATNTDFLPIRKSNSKKEDNQPFINYYRQTKRKIIESIISKLQGLFPKKIHATNIEGFLFKILGFILAHNFCIIFP
jgi:hypothetical protein